MSFGKVISAERRKRGLSQRDLAASIVKDDGSTLSPQYLNDIEHDRRNPPSAEIITKMAAVLDLESEYLFFIAGQMPPDLRDATQSRDSVREAFVAFRRELGRAKGQ